MNIISPKVILDDFIEMQKYLGVTIWLSLAAAVFGLLFGLLVAVIQIKKVKILNPLASVYISIMRGTPIIIQLYVTYFGIPILLKYINYYNGTNFSFDSIPPIVYAIVALGFNTAAYNSVTIKASLESVDPKQIEAAHSLGYTGWQTLTKVTIPEAFEVALPSLGNTLIGLVKGTSLAFTCSVVEITAAGKIMAGRNYRYFEAYIALSVIYWCLSLIMELVMKLLIKQVRIPDQLKEKSIKKKQAAVQKLLAAVPVGENVYGKSKELVQKIC